MDTVGKTTRTDKMFPLYRGNVPINIPKVRLGETNSTTATPLSIDKNEMKRAFSRSNHVEPQNVSHGRPVGFKPPDIQQPEPTTKSPESKQQKKPPFNDPDWDISEQGETSSKRDSVRRINVNKERDVYIPNAFWFEDPSALFQTFDIIPNADMTDAERLNAMTRVIIVISAIMFVVKFPAWWLFLVLGIIVVIILWFIIKGRDQIYAEQMRKYRFNREYLRKPKRQIIQPVNKIIQPIEGTPKNIQNQNIRLVSIP